MGEPIRRAPATLAGTSTGLPPPLLLGHPSPRGPRFFISLSPFTPGSEIFYLFLAPRGLWPGQNFGAPFLCNYSSFYSILLGNFCSRAKKCFKFHGNRLQIRRNRVFSRKNFGAPRTAISPQDLIFLISLSPFTPGSGIFFSEQGWRDYSTVF